MSRDYRESFKHSSSVTGHLSVSVIIYVIFICQSIVSVHCQCLNIVPKFPFHLKPHIFLRQFIFQVRENNGTVNAGLDVKPGKGFQGEKNIHVYLTLAAT